MGYNYPMRIAVFCLFALYFLVVIGCRSAAAPVSVSNKPISINDRPTTTELAPPSKPLADMSWTLEDQRVQKLGDLSGKAVILDFWATYCIPCREEIPHLNSLLAKYGGDNLVIVGLNVGGDEDRVKIPQFTKTTKIDYAVAFPESELSSFIFATRSDIPQTAVIDRKGAMITKIVGFGPAQKKELDEAVEKAVAIPTS